MLNNLFTLDELRNSREGQPEIHTSHKTALMKRLDKLSLGICMHTGKEIILNGTSVYILCIKPDETKVT